MDLSINKVNNAKNLNFKGVKGDYTEKNTPVFKFIPPSVKKGETVTLQFAMLKRGSDDKLVSPKEKDFMEIKFKGDEPLILPQSKLYGNSNGFAYRYKISANGKEDRFVTDAFAKINIADSDAKVNVIEYGNNYGITPKTGTMRHSFLDADAIIDKKTGKLNQNLDKDFVRNHFNKLQGSLKGLNYLLTQTDELDPYRYIISTPDIGADPTSSHKYWPNNLYQCSDMQDFKDFNFELFKRGKGYVADGAFTSQSLQSPLVQHALKWGEESPWYNMLKINGRLELGVLPNILPENPVNPYNHIGVRVVNNPHDKVNYDSKKLTYIQFYDDRLSSEAQREDSTKLIDAYDSAPEDHYDITSNEDSIYPFYFEVDPKQMRQKLEIFKDSNAVLLKDIENGYEDYLTFPNFSVVKREDASGGTFWDGNRDILKMNLSNPTENPKNQKGMQDARNYIYGVATFWTEAIQSDLILRTAKASNSERKEMAIANNIENLEALMARKDATHPVLEQNKTVSDYIKEFPLQSIETSPEMSAIFAQPQFKKEFLSEGTIRNLSSVVNRTLQAAIPEEYKNDDEYKTYVVKVFANEIIKNALVGAINPDLIGDKGEIDLKALKEVGLKQFARNANSPKEEREKTIDRLQEGLDNVSCTKLAERIEDDLKNISLEDFKIAETIVLQGKGGLNWRFDAAKDIGDLDEVKSSNKNFKDIWDGKDGVGQFWTNYIDEVRKYNPAAFVVSEITDFWGFYNNKDHDTFDDFGSNPDEKERKFLARSGSTTSSNYSSYFNKLSCFAGVNPENNNYELNPGDVAKLKEVVEGFVGANQPNNAILSHTFVDNHDKPRLLHALPLDMELYLTEDLKSASRTHKMIAKNVTGLSDYDMMHPKAVAVGEVMLDIINESSKYTDEEKNALEKALRELVNGQKTSESKPNLKRAEAFGVAPYEVTIRDMFKRAGFEGDKLDKAVQNFHKSMLSDKMLGLERMWQMTNAIVGTPTIYNGAEFAQTGYETPSKNVYVANRNPVLHNLKNEDGYKELYSKLYAVSDLYKAPGLSALRDGFPVSLNLTSEDSSIADKTIDQGAMNYFVQQIKDKGGYKKVEEMFAKGYKTQAEYDKAIESTFGIDNGPNGTNWKNFVEYYKNGKLKENYDKGSQIPFQMWPLYKYDDKGSQTISVITNLGVPKEGRSYEFDYKNADNMDKTVSSIDITDKDGNCPIEEGTILKRKIYDTRKGQFVDDRKTYKVKNGKIVNTNGDIKVLDTVMTFYVPKKRNTEIAFTSIYNGAH